MNAGKSIADARSCDDAAVKPAVVEWTLPVVYTALCLLVLSTLLSPATFGPIGALMLTVFVVGLGAALGVPLQPAGTPAHEREGRRQR